MLGDSPFSRGPLADKVGLDGDVSRVEEMIYGTFSTDKEGMDGDTTFS